MTDLIAPVHGELVDRSKKPVRQTLHCYGHIVRLRWDEDAHTGRVTWVDFEVFAAAGYEEKQPSDPVSPRQIHAATGSIPPGAKVLFDRVHDASAAGQPSVTDDLEVAEMCVRGFVKWDGCTQFWTGDPRDPNSGVTHFDDPQALEDWCEMLKQVREWALDAMGEDADER